MPNTDAVLRALATQLAALDEAEVEAEISTYEGEIVQLQAKIQDRFQALQMKRQYDYRQAAEGARSNQTNGRVSDQATIFPAPQEPTVDSGTSGAAEKRHAVLALVNGSFSRIWSSAEVRKALTANGFENPDEGTPVRRILWQFAKDGLIEKVGSNEYTALSANGAASTTDAETP